MAGASAGVVGQAELNTAPGTPSRIASLTPATWTYIWVALAVLIIAGFHVRLFGVALPPAPVTP